MPYTEIKYVEFKELALSLKNKMHRAQIGTIKHILFEKFQTIKLQLETFKVVYALRFIMS